MRKSLLLVLPLVLTGCQTWGPTWSEVSGARYTRTEFHRRPAIIERVDDRGAFAEYPIRMDAGAHRLVLQGLDPGRRGGGTLKEYVLDARPCKRYYVNAQFRNNLGPEWEPVIDYVEDIAGCKA